LTRRHPRKRDFWTRVQTPSSQKYAPSGLFAKIQGPKAPHRPRDPAHFRFGRTATWKFLSVPRGGSPERARPLKGRLGERGCLRGPIVHVGCMGGRGVRSRGRIFAVEKSAGVTRTCGSGRGRLGGDRPRPSGRGAGRLQGGSSFELQGGAASEAGGGIGRIRAGNLHWAHSVPRGRGGYLPNPTSRGGAVASRSRAGGNSAVASLPASRLRIEPSGWARAREKAAPRRRGVLQDLLQGEPGTGRTRWLGGPTAPGRSSPSRDFALAAQRGRPDAICPLGFVGADRSEDDGVNRGREWPQYSRGQARRAIRFPSGVPFGRFFFPRQAGRYFPGGPQGPVQGSSSRSRAS